MMKILVIVVFLAILASLAKALYHLIKPKEAESSQKLVKALTLRIGISVALFLFVILLIATGILKPHGIGSRMQIPEVSKPSNSQDVQRR